MHGTTRSSILFAIHMYFCLDQNKVNKNNIEQVFIWNFNPPPQKKKIAKKWITSLTEKQIILLSTAPLTMWTLVTRDILQAFLGPSVIKTLTEQ